MAECLQRQRNGLLLQVSHNEDSKIHVNQRKPVPACTVRSPYRELVIGSGVVEGGMPPSMSHASSIWQNVYFCLGPSLSLSVDVLIVGLSSVLCGGQKGSVTFWQRRVCLCMNSHNRDVCRPSLWWATCGMPDMREWASGPWGEMQAVCMLLLCPLQRDGPAHHCPLEPRCHSDFFVF